jgi:uncharacterized cupin superfamily protein
MLMDEPAPKPLQTAADIAARAERRIRHPWNPNSEVYLKHLAHDAGLRRVALTLARVPPGKESFVYHSHERDEEFLFILSGRGRAEIDGKFHEVAPGDFMGFTAPGVAHHLTNPYEEDLVYLMGGERSNLDIGHFPKLGRHIIFGPSGINAVDDASLRAMKNEDWLGE